MLHRIHGSMCPHSNGTTALDSGCSKFEGWSGYRSWDCAKKDRIAGFAKVLCHDSVFFTLIFRLFEHFRNQYGISSAMRPMLLIALKNVHTHVCVCVFSLRQKLLTEIDKHLSACSFPCIPLHLIHRKISFLISTQLFLSCS